MFHLQNYLLTNQPGSPSGGCIRNRKSHCSKKLLWIQLRKVRAQNFFIDIRIQSAITLLWYDQPGYDWISFRNENNFLKHFAYNKISAGLKLKMSVICIYWNQISFIFFRKDLYTDIRINFFVLNVYDKRILSLLKFLWEQSLNVYEFFFSDL